MRKIINLIIEYIDYYKIMKRRKNRKISKYSMNDLKEKINKKKT